MKPLFIMMSRNKESGKIKVCELELVAFIDLEILWKYYGVYK